MLADAPTGRAEHAQRMRLVHQQQGMVSLLNFYNAFERGDVAVHAIDTFDGNQNPPEVMTRLPKYVVKRIHVVVGKGASFGSRQSDAGENRIMRQAVV